MATTITLPDSVVSDTLSACMPLHSLGTIMRAVTLTSHPPPLPPTPVPCLRRKRKLLPGWQLGGGGKPLSLAY